MAALEPTVDLLAFELGLDVNGTDPKVRADLIARVTRAGHRIGEGYRPFPPECGHGAHRLEAL